MLIDSHCHIPHKKYELSTDEILQEASVDGVSHIITIGTSISDSRRTIESVSHIDNVYCTAGVYPHDDTSLSTEDIYERLDNMLHAHKKKIVGIGECGIDMTGWKGGRSLEEQYDLFQLQIGLAIEKDLPIVVHNRNGDADILEILEKYKDTTLRGVVHCFTSDWEFAKKVLDLGFHISFTAIVTYPSAGDELLEVVRRVPSDRYLVETDAPYLPPQGHRGQINYPKYVTMTARKIAEIRNESFEQVSQDTFKNTSDLFKLDL